MRVRNKVALGFISVLLIVVGLAAAAMAGNFVDSGMIEVVVREAQGNRVNIKVPAAMVTAATMACPGSLLDDALEECGQFLPMARAVCDELEDLPDFTLVSVESDEETVLIRTENGRFLVDVRTSEEYVHVKVPMKVVTKVLRKMERRNHWI